MSRVYKETPSGWYICIKHRWRSDDDFERVCRNCNKIQRRSFSKDPWRNLIHAEGKIKKCDLCKTPEPISHCTHAHICWSCHDSGKVFCSECAGMRPATNPSPSGTIGYVPIGAVGHGHTYGATGATGPAGVMGPIGATGVTGPTGPAYIDPPEENWQRKLI